MRQALGTLNRKALLHRCPFIGTIATKFAPPVSRAKTRHVAIFVSDSDSEHLSAFLHKIVGECSHCSLVTQSYYVKWVGNIDLGHWHALRSPAEEGCISLTNKHILDALSKASYRTASMEAPARDFIGSAAEIDAPWQSKSG